MRVAPKSRMRKQPKVDPSAKLPNLQPDPTLKKAIVVTHVGAKTRRKVRRPSEQQSRR